MSKANTLKYFLLSQYLEPKTLDESKKTNSKFKKSMDLEITNFDEKFLQILRAFDRPLLKNGVEISIYGGIFETELLALTISKLAKVKFQKEQILDELRSEQTSFDKAFCYKFKLAGDLVFCKNEQSFALKEANLDDELSPFFTPSSSNDLFISTAPWAIVRLDHLKEISQNDFNKECERIKDKLSIYKKKVRLSEYLKVVHEELKNSLKTPFCKDMIRLEIRIADPNFKESESLLNSFFIDDINLLIKFYESGRTHKLTDQLLDEGSENKFERLDVRDELNQRAVRDFFRAERYPRSAFASDYALNFSQQMALNNIIEKFKEGSGGIYSVNGAPGIGKTTLLKDVMAEVVTLRAMKLAQMSRHDIFEPVYDSDKKVLYFKLNDELQGYEMVVSSCNNGAVEILSKELSQQKSIGDYAGEIDYFKFIATRLLSVDEKTKFGEKSFISKPAWGLFCVALGSKQNKSNFVFNAINGVKIEATHSQYDETLKEYGEFLEQDGFLMGLGKYLATGDEIDDFDEAKEKFNQALHEVNLLFSEIRIKEEELNGLKTELSDIDRRLESYNSARQVDELLQPLKEELFKNSRELDAKKTEAEELRRLVNQNEALQEYLNLPQKPAFFTFQQIFKTDAFEKYNDEVIKIGEINRQIAEQNLKASKQNSENREKNKARLDELEIEMAELDDKISQLNTKIDYFSRLCDDFNRRQKIIGRSEELDNYLNGNFSKSNEEMQKSMPFMMELGVDEKFYKTKLFRGRIELFKEALNLHKSAIFACKEAVRTNLRALSIIFNDEKMAEKNGLKSKDRREIIKGLFLLTPVVSSTFASFNNTFKDLLNGDIGMLLIDESGQANLTNALGALLRSKMAVVVGDPLQLEPVVTLPVSLNNAILSYCEAKEEFNLLKSSLQLRADKVQNIGTYIKGSGESIWVGSPLIVHRRCANPMFEISNETTYDDMMILGRSAASKFKNTNVQTKWIDVRSEEWIGNYNKAEGDVVKKLLESELASEKNNIRIITPFKDVCRNLKGAGTIHTMQGKEADVIVFVLGGATKGARAWAASKPNLLNVALTRAKEVIYIVGNRENWASLPYFEVAARKIDKG
ncbi:DEAD/DEAH box helicase [Campylobacter sp.]|uniref:DEAD/DEAH box helicase n=1 Tax=Campylobacter sp. TaxID=205 RepID=UPI003FA0375D